MSIRSPTRDRYDRRSRSRRRRVQRRLDTLRGARDVRSAAGGRTLSRSVQVAIFACSLLIGLGFARAVTATAITWWSEEPALLEAIAVQGTKRLTGEEIARATGLARGGPVDALSPGALAEQVATHPWVRSARVAVLPTGTVIVDVDERRPRALLRSPDQSGERSAWHFVDDAGVAFARVPARLSRAGSVEFARLPALGMHAASDHLRNAPDPTMRDALALLSRLDGLVLEGLARPDRPHRGLELWLPDGDADSGWVLRRTQPELQVILGRGDVAAVSERLDRLERLLSAGLAETRATESIDMRFAGQAVLRTRSASR